MIGSVAKVAAGRLQIGSQQDLQIMSHRDFSGLAAFVEEVQAVLIAGVVQIFEFQSSHRANSDAV
jgi:hypothetical protein